MKKFIIITNEMKDIDFKVTKKFEELIEKAGLFSIRYTNQEIEENSYDCAIVIGGDGSLLIAAGLLIDKNIPILGINLGTLGFLVEVSVDKLEEALDSLLKGEYFIEERMLLKAILIKENGEEVSSFALNDIVLSKYIDLSIIRYKLIVNDSTLYTYNADGIIVSTPTGSTGYSLSAGGPIIAPTAELFLVTPICAHNLSSRSVVLSSEDTITIELCALNNNIRSSGIVLSDGKKIGEQQLFDKLIITKSRKKTKLIKIDKISFLETLKRKINV